MQIPSIHALHVPSYPISHVNAQGFIDKLFSTNYARYFGQYFVYSASFFQIFFYGHFLIDCWSSSTNRYTKRVDSRYQLRANVHPSGKLKSVGAKRGETGPYTKRCFAACDIIGSKSWETLNKQTFDIVWRVFDKQQWICLLHAELT